MENSLQWLGNLSLTHNGYYVPTLESFALDDRYLYWEKQILIQALERFLDLVDDIEDPIVKLFQRNGDI